MKLDCSALPPGAVYAYNTHQDNEIIMVNLKGTPSSMIGTDDILVEVDEEVVADEEVVVEEEEEEVVEKPVKKISNYSNRGKKK